MKLVGWNSDEPRQQETIVKGTRNSDEPSQQDTILEGKYWA